MTAATRPQPPSSARRLALPAALLALLLATWAWRVDAAGDSAPSSTVTITPARILDTRDGTDLGLPGPFVNGTSQRLQVTGPIATSTGTRQVVPAGATGVLLNITAVRSTANGYVSVRPGTESGVTETSSLNFNAGSNTANAVTVALPTTGASAGILDIFLGGSTPNSTADIIVDVTGYLTATAVGGPTIVSAAQGDAVFLPDGGDSDPLDIVTLTFVAPTEGQLLVNSSAAVSDQVPGGKIFCNITDGTTTGNFQGWEAAGPNGSVGQLAGTAVFPVGPGTVTIALSCYSATSADDPNTANINAATLTGIFGPT